MNKKLKIFISIILLYFLSLNSSFAIKITINDYRTNIKTINGKIVKNIKLGDIFLYFSNFYKDQTPESYKFINLNYKGTDKNLELKKALQILVYNDKIKNLNIYINSNKDVNAYSFYKLSNTILGTDISNINKDILLSRNTNSNDLDLVKYSYFGIKEKEEFEKKNSIEQSRLFKDVYETIKNDHYNKNNIKENDLIYSAIEGLAKGTKDKYTVYFPPIKNKSFKQILTGDFEGIGAYVELKEPGNFIIVSPISDSPAEKAGLKGGDRVIKVGDKEITKDNSSEEIISWIKGKIGTKIKLTILRKSEKLEIEVERAKIHISNIESEIKNNGAYYIKIKNFGNSASKEFSETLEKISNEIGITKIIFDLRNNGGGYLDEVTNMLSYVIPKGEKTAVIKYLGNEKSYISKGYNTLDLNKYEVIILQNSGTASASEIMIGTLKDYFPKIKIIGEKSYGKGSVQTIKSYSDGSSFKYTVAKWFTGKSETGIDEIGIKPDIELELNQEEYNSNQRDNQLEKALE